MIFVDRSTVKIPESLLNPRVKFEIEKIANLLSKSRAHQEQLRVNFRSDIYLGAKEQLMKLFHGKCAYCETAIVPFEFGDVEHFRPKQRAKQLDGRRDDFHYAWLAYEWENLIIACKACNQGGKMNLFPVRGQLAPPMASVGECRSVEDYLLIDPCFNRPEEHLAFERDGSCRALSDGKMLKETNHGPHWTNHTYSFSSCANRVGRCRMDM